MSGRIGNRPATGAGPMPSLYRWPAEGESRAEAFRIIKRIGEALGSQNIPPESMFRHVDKDRDTIISPNEFSAMMKQWEPNISAETLLIAFREFDRNSSGHIDLREFCAALERAGAPKLGIKLPMPTIEEVRRAELMQEVIDLQTGLQDLDELARLKRCALTGQEQPVTKRRWPDVSTLDIPALEAEQSRLTDELLAAEKPDSPACALMPPLPNLDQRAGPPSPPSYTASGVSAPACAAGGTAGYAAGAASIASAGESQAGQGSGYAAAPVPPAGQTKAGQGSGYAAAPVPPAGQTKAASLNAFGSTASKARQEKTPIPAGTSVEYLSTSQRKWLPAMVQGFDATAGTYKLDVKAAVALQDVRLPFCCNLLRLDPNCGVQVNEQWHGSSMGPANDAHRDNVREGTKEQVVKRLGLLTFGDNFRCARAGPPGYKDTVLFVDQSAFAAQGSAPSGGQNLLGRYDCVALRICADYDKDWKFIQGARPSFWVLHAAAVNIGENVRTSEIADFRKEGLNSLDEDKYLKAMLRIFDNVMMVCNTLEAEHLVLFPFGMGAFLRNLHLLDATYCDPLALQQLRCGIVAKMVEALSGSCPQLRIHICLGGDSEEARCNMDAFIRGFRAAGQGVKDRTEIWSGADAFQLSHDLASQSSKVLLLNGANRRLLGNHWFEGGARRAIDENLHRRSWIMSALAYMLNGYSSKRTFANRSPNELRDNVQWLGGKVYNY
eukprot:TRINITY_DN23601_c0_g1_i1.p1 TRINITY_DN23601_c0_g1~~TRINITY_DN23601_c0_g1_i1.p1  ORF type:complete len:723 (-),score=107.44 TRINITY_DN23601_c0_g1_i1:70-2238(-)